MTVHRDKFRKIKPTRCTNFSNLLWNETLHVSDSSSVHHQEFFTVHTAMVYVIHVFWQLASRIRIPYWSYLQATVKNSWFFFTVYTAMVYVSQDFLQLTSRIRIPSWSCLQATVKNSWWWTEELSETCTVSFQNKFEKWVHLVGFIVGNPIYYFKYRKHV